MEGTNIPKKERKKKEIGEEGEEISYGDK